ASSSSVLPTTGVRTIRPGAATDPASTTSCSPSLPVVSPLNHSLVVDSQAASTTSSPRTRGGGVERSSGSPGTYSRSRAATLHWSLPSPSSTTATPPPAPATNSTHFSTRAKPTRSPPNSPDCLPARSPRSSEPRRQHSRRTTTPTARTLTRRDAEHAGTCG